MPGSVTSSLNSSESEQGSLPQSAGSRGTAGSNRSVFLHATAVADIPTQQTRNPGEPATNLKNSKKISRSISLLTPFKPKQKAKGPQEVNYDSAGNIVHAAKPPRPPPARRGAPVNGAMTKDKRFASSSDLLRDEDAIVAAPERKIKVLKPASKVSRSVSMPKDTRLAGWFKKRKKV